MNPAGAPQPLRRDTLIEQLASRIREQIRNGQLPAGDSLPSSRQMGSDYGVGSATVQSAMDILAAEGLIGSTDRSRRYVQKGATLNAEIDFVTYINPQYVCEEDDGQARYVQLDPNPTERTGVYLQLRSWAADPPYEHPAFDRLVGHHIRVRLDSVGELEQQDPDNPETGAPTMSNPDAERAAIGLAAVAYDHALAGRWEAAVQTVKRISDEYGGDGVLTALITWCDAYIEHATDGRMDVATGVLTGYIDGDTGRLQGSESDQVPSRVKWAGQVVAARGAMDEERFMALLAEPTDENEFGSHVFAVLETVATTVNGLPRGFVPATGERRQPR